MGVLKIPENKFRSLEVTNYEDRQQRTAEPLTTENDRNPVTRTPESSKIKGYSSHIIVVLSSG